MESNQQFENLLKIRTIQSVGLETVNIKFAQKLYKHTLFLYVHPI